MFQSPGWTPRVRWALKRVWRASTAATVRLGNNFIKQKLQGRSVLVWADHIFRSNIRSRKDLGPMCFWSHGQLFSGNFYYTKGVVLLPSSQLGQV
jgi:hypothetical protein